MTLSDVISKRIVYGKDAVIADTVTSKKAVFSDNSSTEAVRINQIGSGPALIVEDETHPDSTPFSVQSDGRVVIGTDNPFPGSNSKLQVVGFPRFRVANNDEFSAGIAFDKARGTINSPEIVQNNDRTGFIDFYGHNGTDYQINARIRAEVDGSPSGANVPGRIRFFTAQTNTLSEAMRIDKDGHVGIGEADPQATLHVDGDLRLDISTASSATAGSSGGVPGQVEGYLIVNINGSNKRIPYYNA